MAKKKKQELTSEQLLAEALVREEDWPYRVPGNWVWVRLGSVAEIVTGGTPSKKNPSFYGGDFPFIKPTNLDQGRHVLFAEEYLTEEGKKISRIIPAGSTSVCCIGSIGKCGYLDVEATTNQQINSVLPKINKHYCYYYCCTNFFKNQLNELSSATTISIVNKSKMLSTIIPLPPLAEQQRIVDRVESLFDKLDQAKDLIQEALDSFETRKTAILHQAFTGELTKKWREEHGDELESWQKTTIKEIAKFRTGYAFNSKEFSDTGYQVIRMGNLYNGILDLQRNPVFISPELLDSSIVRKYLVKNGDILLTLTGTKYKRDYGYAVLMGENKSLLLNQRIVSLTPERIETNFLFHYLQTELFRNVFFSNETGGVNQGNVSSKFVENIKIPFPTLPEQKEIVRILDDLFEKEQNAKDLCDLIDQIEAMKKAILGKAFRGELGTNETGDESAIELLKVIL